MKKGFALLETIIAITFLAVSLLMLYGTFTTMVSNSRRNVYYDNVSDIYKVYYLKEYLFANGFSEVIDNQDIKQVKCEDLKIASCAKLFKTLKVNNLYITKYDLKNIDTSKYNKSFNDYINTLSNKGEFKYRLIFEFDNNIYANIGLGE